MLYGKNVLLGITASIAAYKSAFLCRLLIKEGANVKVLMTPDSVNFIGPLTLSTLSKNPVYTKYYNSESGEWTNHVDLAKWADLMLIAPATANTLAKMSAGICDNLLLATYLSMESKVYIAPAMDLDMYKHSSTQHNLNQLEKKGHVIIPSEKGELASGLVGEGRMAEPETMIALLRGKPNKLSGRKVLISAGPTYENIDAVRFIGNRSSGKMGLALARVFKSRGAVVSLVLGPTSQKIPEVDQLIKVESAHEMENVMLKHCSDADIIVMSAAVSDYKLEQPLNSKIKKKDQNLSLDLSPTNDILKLIGERKSSHQTLIGFALETDNEIENAKSKLERKNLDAIVLNSLKDKWAGFGTDTNKVRIIDKQNNVKEFELKDKLEVAKDIVNYITTIINE